MKAFIFSIFILLLSACDMRPPKGSGQNLQQRFDKMEEEKHQDIEHLEREMEEEEDRREVNSGTYNKEINFTPAKN